MSCRQKAIAAAKRADSWPQFRTMTKGSTCSLPVLGEIWRNHNRVTTKSSPKKSPRKSPHKSNNKIARNANDKTVVVYYGRNPFQGRRSSRRNSPRQGCRRQYTKKYVTRGSPPYPANECAEMIMKGNDGDIYQSRSDYRGIFKWTKL
jgi:hypothetical protein